MSLIGLPIGWNTSVLRSMLIVVIVFSIGLNSDDQTPFNLNMLLLIPANTTSAIANRSAGAIVLALDAIKKRGTFHNIQVNWHLDDPQCSTRLTAKHFYKRRSDSFLNPHVIVGGYCEDVCNLLAIITYALEIPFLASGCRKNSERNHVKMPTFLTFDYDHFDAFPAVIALMRAYNWKRLAIMATTDQTSYEMGLNAKKEVERQGWTAIFILTTMSVVPEGFTSPEADEEVKMLLKDIKDRARIVFFSMNMIHAARILVLAQEEGMYNGEYAFIGFELPRVDPQEIKASVSDWRMAKIGLIFIEPTNIYQLLEGNRFVQSINDQLANTSATPALEWINRIRLDAKDLISLRKAGAIYVALRIYSHIVNRTLEALNITADRDSVETEKAVSNGTLLLSRIYQYSMEGTRNLPSVDDNLGMLRFDKNGTRIPLWHIKNFQEFEREFLMFLYSKEDIEELEYQKQKLIWPGKTTEVPLDEPKCGWNYEKCIHVKDLIWICVCAILGFLVLAGFVFAIYVTRRMKHEAERKTLADWQVKWKQVIVLGDNVIGRLSQHDTATRSTLSFEATSQADLGDIRSVHKSMTGRLHTLTGTYKGKTVAIKKINRPSVDIFESAIYTEIKQLFYISHENVNPFIGVCSEAPNVCVLMLYADRGSLQDVLDETKHEINWEFRICLATDIAKGMEYLHESPVGPHGHLTSSNCVIDRKWECKITDYGLKQFKRTKTQDISTFRWNSDLLWTAPEILQKPDTDRTRIYGTKEGDIYSFGIIVSEIITREMPYHSLLESITPEDVVMKLKGDPQFRPDLPKPEGPIGAGWNSLAIICWHRKPEVRPSFKMIHGKLTAINGGKIPNLMERMQRMMEDALQRKETAIGAERKRTETVVYNLLPQIVADRLVDGKQIRPQRLEVVTLCYCETTDVLATIKTLSPIQVTDILRSLFGLYEDVMKRYQVTEVGGRGSKDSMFVGSGIPQFAEGHAAEICELSLDLISEALSFRTPLAPLLSLNLKIAIHSGPVLTAVIWRTLPRYCVSGEAVDTVMALQSASKAMRVRISEATYNHIKKSGSFTIQEGGKVTVKDAKAMRTYWLTGKTGYRKPLPSSIKQRSSSLAEEKEGLAGN